MAISSPCLVSRNPTVPRCDRPRRGSGASTDPRGDVQTRLTRPRAATAPTRSWQARIENGTFTLTAGRVPVLRLRRSRGDGAAAGLLRSPGNFPLPRPAGAPARPHFHARKSGQVASVRLRRRDHRRLASATRRSSLWRTGRSSTAPSSTRRRRSRRRPSPRTDIRRRDVRRSRIQRTGVGRRARTS
jgi:hypothetical protein